MYGCMYLKIVFVDEYKSQSMCKRAKGLALSRNGGIVSSNQPLINSTPGIFGIIPPVLKYPL